MSIQNDGITERAREIRAAEERGFRAGVEAAARLITDAALEVKTGKTAVTLALVARRIRESALAASPPPATECGRCASCGGVSGIEGCLCGPVEMQGLAVPEIATLRASLAAAEARVREVERALREVLEAREFGEYTGAVEAAERALRAALAAAPNAPDATTAKEEP